MGGVEQELEDFAGLRSLSSTMKPILKGRKGSFDTLFDKGKPASKIIQWSAHAQDRTIHIHELGAEVNKICIVSVDELHKLALEEPEMAAKLCAQSIEGHKLAQICNVGLAAEI